jgi:hypothetical protein
MSANKLKLEMEMAAFRASATNDIGDGIGIWRGGSNPSRWGWRGARWRMKKGGVDIENIYEICIKPYALPGTTVVDIGTNGGFWLSKMLDGKVHRALGIDVFPPEHLGFVNNIYNWHGPDVFMDQTVNFMQVTDFCLGAIGDNSLDLVFSYDVFCHISWLGAQEYIKNLYSKMTSGANAFIMIADADKYPFTRETSEPGHTQEDSLARTARLHDYQAVVADRDGTHSHFPGRWYFYGIEDFCAFVETCGFEVVNRDATPEGDRVNTIVHFRKPNLGDTYYD